MGTGISRPGFGRLSVFVLGLAALGLAACGAVHRAGSRQASGGSAAFAWLHPQPPPADWKLARIPSGAALVYPPSWSRQRGDPGTATATLINRDGRFLGYLNLTPRQGNESLSNWTSFRIAHNREEGDRDVVRLAAATSLPFLTGHGSCVKDSYRTVTGARFIEIACLVAGNRAESVIVGAAPPASWGQTSQAIERAIDGVKV